MGAPARITKAAVTTEVTEFVANINRARELYLKIVRHGYTAPAIPAGSPPIKLPIADTRDAAQFIFFEVAAKFEDFAKSMFQAEVRSRMKVTATRSEYIMGDLDSGLNNKLGWGSPQRLKERGRNLFGPAGFFGNLIVSISEKTYNTLIAAHTVRNRIAHDGGAALTKFVKLMEGEGIAKNVRQGMSIGRYICEYPASSAVTDRHFHRFLAAYQDFAQKAGAALP